jgi:hypothetical protein
VTFGTLGAMTRTNRAWIGFLVAPGAPAILLYLFGRLKGYGDGAVVGPMLLALPAYASALVLGLPVHLLLRRHGLRGFGYYAGVGAAIGLASVVAITAMQVILAWNWTPDNARALSLWKYSGRYMVIAALYAALASAAFWVIAVRQPRPTA